MTGGVKQRYFLEIYLVFDITLVLSAKNILNETCKTKVEPIAMVSFK